MMPEDFDSSLTCFELGSSAPARKELRRLDASSEPPAVVSCMHDKGEHGWTSLIHTAQQSAEHKKLLIGLVNRGYHLFKAPQLGSLFVHRTHISKVWPELISGEYSVTSDQLVYHLTYPQNEARKPARMLVLLSPVAANRFTQLLDRHFAMFFKSIAKYMHDDTLILRIADLGGVVGSFYLPTQNRPNNSEEVNRLIIAIAAEHRIPHERVVVYGASKGGTGALYSSLKFGWRAVCVDPIVSKREPNDDPYYGSTSIFLHEREELILSLSREIVSRGISTPQITVITSPPSREYQAIRRLFAQKGLSAHARLLIANSPLITEHAEVSRNTIPAVVSILNAQLIDLHSNAGIYSY